MNMSFGSDTYGAQVAEAVWRSYRVEPGDLLVAIAGNMNQHCLEPGVVTYPGAFPEVIAVSGTTLRDEFDPGSCSGAQVEISAPATVTTLAVGNSIREARGASMDRGC